MKKSSKPNPLVGKLLSTYPPDREEGLAEVYARTERGDRSGFDAIEEALANLAGSPKLELYRPEGKELPPAFRSQAKSAHDNLIQLVLMRDLASDLLQYAGMVQMYIHQAAAAGDSERVRERMSRMGDKEYRAFQLLGLDMMVYVELRSRGILGRLSPTVQLP